MRHQVKGYRLNRSGGHRTAMRKTMIKQLFEHERITTTLAKAKSIQAEAERLITLARNSAAEDDTTQVNARRQVAGKLGNASADIVKKLFDDIAPRFKKSTRWLHPHPQVRPSPRRQRRDGPD